MKTTAFVMGAWLAVGCGGSIVQIGGEGGSAGGGGAGGTTATGGTVTTGVTNTTGSTSTTAAAGSGGRGGSSGAGTGGSAGTGGRSGDGGDGGACVRTDAGLSIHVTRGSETLDCAHVRIGTPDAGGSYVIEGVVTAVGGNSFTINSCPPGADCVAGTIAVADTIAQVQIDATFTWLLTKGTLVRVEYAVTGIFGCQQSLEVTALGSWGGLSNPEWPKGTLFLAASDGGGPFADSPYQVRHVPLGCAADAGRGCGVEPPDDYALVFTPNGAPDKAITVYMGETRLTEIQLVGERGAFARNLRSFQTPACDDYWNFAYLLTAATFLL